MTVRRFETDELDPYARGVALGRFGADEIAANVAGYSELFEVVGVQPGDLPRLGREAAEQIAAWAPDLATELRGQADGAGLELWQLGMLNARTEILATVGAIGEGECSTSVVLPEAGPPRTVQTWDWHDVSNDDTLVVRYLARPGHEVRYFTEFGILGKIGVNSAGLGVHFNILNHANDGDGIGVPVHAVARQLLEQATSLDEAIEIARSASVTASTVLTIVAYRDGRSDAACVELSSGGTAVVRPTGDGVLLHTNHFLDDALAGGEMVPDTSSTYPRLEHLRDRLGALTSMDAVERAGVGMLVHEADGAPVCCHPDPALSFEHRWQTLLTISLDVEGGHLQFHEGGPCTVTRDSWQVF
ncbi:C45 family peptidase [Agromyces silvae]|uniref:C45 family peptidase n=1 Tax=Agromyces silvae TaxID=3388266 RepID=UPI00280AC0C1|nr:C45 family peptidase [Agromyces protaetiae]